VHRDRLAELRLARRNGPEFADFAGFRAGRASRSLGWLSHGVIIARLKAFLSLEPWALTL
jgi:hypothetical protein